MRILILSDFFPSQVVPNEAVFIGEIVSRLARHHRLALAVPTVHYIPIPRYRHLRREFNPSVLRETYHVRPILFSHLHIPLVGEWVFPYVTVLPLLLRLKKAVPKIDLIHAHWAYRSGFWGAWLAKILKVPLIITLHGSDANVWLQEKRKRKKIIFALKQADGIIASSSSLLKKIDPIPSRTKTAVISGGFDPGKFFPQTAKSTHPKPVFVCIANFYPIKGLDRFIYAINLLRQKSPSFSVRIVGDGPERENVRQLIRSLNLENIVTLMGSLDHDKIPHVLRKADFLVIPSSAEGQPIVLFEAMAVGLPVVSTPVGIVPEFLSNGVFGVMAKNFSPGALAAAMEQALKRSFDRDAIASFARKFSWENTVNKIENFYEKIVSA